MRFISIFTHEPSNRSPTPDEMAKMGKLIEDAIKEGWLLTTEGVSFGSKGVRVHRDAAGKVAITDGPFAGGQRSARGLCVATGRVARGDIEAHAALPRSDRARHVRDLSAVRNAGPVTLAFSRTARTTIAGV